MKITVLHSHPPVIEQSAETLDSLQVTSRHSSNAGNVDSTHSYGPIYSIAHRGGTRPPPPKETSIEDVINRINSGKRITEVSSLNNDISTYEKGSIES